MAERVFGRVRAFLRRREPGQAARGQAADEQAAERAYRLTVALAERRSAQVAKVRRWGAYACHIPNDPYDDRLTRAGKRV